MTGAAARRRRAGLASLAVGGALAAVGFWLFRDGRLAPDTRRGYVLGTGLALFTTLLVVWLHGLWLDRDPSLSPGRRAARLQALLVASFLIKLATLAFGVVALYGFAAKFTELATFAVTFAAGSLVCQSVAVAVLARGRAEHTQASAEREAERSATLSTESRPHGPKLSTGAPPAGE